MGLVAAQSIYDARLVEVDLQLPDKTLTFSNMNGNNIAISAVGSKFGGATQNTCELRIMNLSKQLRNEILTLSSPLRQPRTPINLTLKVGRQSYGMFVLFQGNVISSDVTQPPDIGVLLRSLTGNYQQGAIAAVQFGQMTPLSVIAKAQADRMGLALNNQSTDKQVANFSYSGSNQIGIDKLNEMGGVQCWVDNGTLVMVDSDKALNGEAIPIDAAHGMVGIPQVTQQGVIVTTLIMPRINLGSSVKITSEINPAANGTYKVIKINYELATRDQPFYYILETSNLGVYQGF